MTVSDKTLDPAATHYQRELDAANELVSGTLRQWYLLGWLRGGLFLSGAALGVWALIRAGRDGPVWWWVVGVVAVAFLVVVFLHESVADRIRLARLRGRMFREGLDRLGRRLAHVPAGQVGVTGTVAPAVRDLDLLGDHSLHKLLATAHTHDGGGALLRWLLERSTLDAIRQRQAAARSLADERAWREEFELVARQLAAASRSRWTADGKRDSGPGMTLVAWSGAEGWLAKRQWILWLARIAAVVALGGILLTVVGGVPIAWTGIPVLAATAVNFLLAVFCSGSIHDEFNRVTSGHQEMAAFQRLFALLDACPAQAEKLHQLRTALFGHGNDVRRELGRLGRLASAASLRKGLWFLPWMLLQFTAFLDVHVLDLLDRWKRRHGHQVAGWFQALGEWEALGAIGRLAWEHPDWCWPELEPPGQGPKQRLEASGLGHPLIAAEKAVVNDVAIGPPGTFLLVTGSNMSGKSTLLRAVGLNVFLATTGAPVFARSMRLPLMEVSTSMRVSDSLADGVSFFMAELQRLKSIVDTAQQLKDGPDRGHLFLLDEILQGTNSRERQIAVTAVIQSLTAAGSLGAVSTHDLELAAVPELADRCETVHFREHFVDTPGGRVMKFDYALRPGVSPTTNALTLLEMVGLGRP